MFKPVFRTTNKIVQYIAEISAARGYLSELVNKDLIKSIGPQKGRYYTLI